MGKYPPLPYNPAHCQATWITGKKKKKHANPEWIYAASYNSVQVKSSYVLQSCEETELLFNVLK